MTSAPKLLFCLLLVPLDACIPGTQTTTTATGHLVVAGDEKWDTALVGIGLSHFMGPTPCLLRLYDVYHNGENDATYKLQIEIGQSSKLPAYFTGVQQVGIMPASMATASAALFEGSKHTQQTYYPTSGTVTITRFDATRFTGSFDFAADRSCYDKGMTVCHSQATGTFDANIEDCIPPLQN